MSSPQQELGSPLLIATDAKGVIVLAPEAPDWVGRPLGEWVEIPTLDTLIARYEAAWLPQSHQLNGHINNQLVEFDLSPRYDLSPPSPRFCGLQGLIKHSQKTPSMTQAVFENAHDALFILDGLTITEANPRSETMFGRTRAEMIGKTPLEISPNLPGMKERAEDAIRLALKGNPHVFPWMHTRADETPFEAEISLSPLYLNRPCALAIVRDVSERVSTAAALRRSEERFRRVFEHAPVAIGLSRLDGVLLAVNERLAELLGDTPARIVGHLVRDFLGTEYDPREERIFVHEAPIGACLDRPRCAYRRADGVVVYAHSVLTKVEGDDGEPQVLALLRDVSTEVKAEAEHAALQHQLFQAQRLEDVGRIASGVAHDFNNLLTVITANLDLFDLIDDPVERVEFTSAIRTAVDRAAHLTRQLLVFARRHIVEIETISISVVLKELQHLLQRVIPENVIVEVMVDPGELAVRMDATQLHQVVMNLAVNAADAMSDGGSLIIEADRRHEDGVDYVVVTVSDTGHGIEPDVLPLIFEPFFTTKGAGKGTGLGLSTTRTIAQQAGGFVRVSSVIGEGASFSVWLPAVEGGDEASEVEEQETPVGHGETLLLVENDEAIRRVTARMLRSAGYQVVSAGSGHEALEIFSQIKPLVVITDLMMPGMSGIELVDTLALRSPGLAVLCVSGYASDGAKTTEAVTERHLPFLSKPFRRRQLLERVRRLLEGERL